MKDDMPRTRKAAPPSRGSKRRRPALWRRAAYNGMRLGLWSLAAVLFILFVNKVWHPYDLNRRLQKDLMETSAELLSVQQDNDRQIRRIENLKSLQGQVAAARRMGYHLPGEVPMRLQEPKPKAETTPPTSEPGR